MVVGLPILLPVAAIIDIVKRRPWICVRITIFFVLYLMFELIAATAIPLVWLVSGVWAGGSVLRYYRWNFWIQRWWVAGIMGFLLPLFNVKLRTEGDTDFEARPFMLFLRHVSVTDTIVPPYLLYPRGIHLRIVLKRELAWDPALDMSFSALPNCFVTRGSSNTEKEAEEVGRLMDRLTPYEAVMIYPEGTRFTEAKKARVLEKIKASGDEAAYQRAKGFRTVLPPRPGGPLRLLERNTNADAIFCAHVGLEKATGFMDLWNGGPIGQTVRFHFWRVPFEAIPKEPKAQAEWLYEQWKLVDEFVYENTARNPGVS